VSTETLVTDGTSTETVTDPQTTAAPSGNLLDVPNQQESKDPAAETTDPKPADAAKDEPAAVPESYEFTVPEGHTLTDEIRDELTALAKERGLSQEAAQQMLNDRAAWADKFKQANVKALDEARTVWAEETKKDKELGGDKLQENLGLARKALDKFGTPALRELLNESGLGNHPEVVRMLLKAGRAISDDVVVTTGRGNGSQGDDIAKKLFPNQA
jgi:hypothetical protein